MTERIQLALDEYGATNALPLIERFGDDRVKRLLVEEARYSYDAIAVLTPEGWQAVDFLDFLIVDDNGDLHTEKTPGVTR